MRIRCLPIIILVLAFNQLCAQADSAHVVKRIGYFNNFLSGGLLGEKGKGTSLTFATTHGTRLKELSLGLGLGYDAYVNWRVIPAFVSISYDIAKVKNNRIFLNCNTGYAIAKAVRNFSQFNQLDYTDVKGGVMLNPMLGYRIETGPYSLYFSTGYKWQRNKYDVVDSSWIWGFPQSKTSVREEISRVVIQLGFGWH